MPFDIMTARRDGYTDDEIISYLSTDFDVGSAMSDGYSLDEIAAFVGKAPAAVQTEMALTPAHEPEAPYMPEIESLPPSTVAVAPTEPMEAIPRITSDPESSQQVAEELFAADPERYPKEEKKRNLLQNVAEAFQRGDVQSTLDYMAYEASVGDRDWEEVDKIRKEFQKRQAEDPVEANSWLTTSVMGLSGMLPAMIKGLAEGVKGGAGGAVGGAAAGALGGPVSPLTTPAFAATGYAVGSAFGSTEYWRRLGAGAMYSDMKAKGVSDKTSKVLSTIASVPYALIEQSQVGRAIPGADKLLKKIVTDNIVKTAAKFVTKKGIEIGQEVLEEGMQGAIDQTTQEIGQYVDGQLGREDLAESAKNVLTRFTTDLTESIGPMMLLMGPKIATGGIQIGVEVKRKAEKGVEKLAEVKEEAVEATKEKMLEEGGIITESMQREKRVPKPPDTKVIKAIEKEKEAEFKKEVKEEVEISKPVKPEVEEALPPLGKELEEAERAVTEKPEPTVEKEKPVEVRKEPEAAEEKKVEEVPPKKVVEKVVPLEEPVTFKESISEVEKQVPKELWKNLDIRIEKTPEKTQGAIVKEGDKLKISLDPEMPADRVVPVIFHEVMGHAGASNVLRTNDKVYKRLSTLYKTTTAKGLKDQIRTTYSEEFKGMDKAEAEEALFSEWIAHNIETHLASPKKKGVPYQIYQAVRQFLADLGLKKDTIDTAMESVVREIRKTTKFEAKVETKPKFAKELKPFYSPTERAVSELKQEKGVVPQIQSMIKKGTLKKAEVEWMGLEEWLSDNPKATRTEVQDFVKANEVTVEESERREGGFERKTARQQELIDRENAGTITEEERAELDIVDAEVQRGEEGPDAVKHETWVLPGAENYRELLFRMPIKTALPSHWLVTQSQKYGWVVTKPDGETIQGATREDVVANALEKWKPTKKEDIYRTTHWEEPNVFAHARVNDRVTPEGEKVLFIEEIQSDWAREAREKGVKGKKLAAAIFDSKEQVEKAIKMAYLPEQKATPKLVEGKWRIEYALIKGVPDFPFRKNWQEFVLKNLLKRAVAEGYDRISWVTGEQTADRYDLSKQVDGIQFWKNDDGTININILKDNRTAVSKPNLTEKEVEELVGKDITRKITESKVKDDTLEGVDLKIGGEWAKNIYDKMIPQFLKKYAKKWDAKIEEIDFRTEEAPRTKKYMDFVDKMQEKYEYFGTPEVLYDELSEAEQIRMDALKADMATEEPSGLAKQLSLPITPAMRESIPAGQPMFAKELPEAKERRLTPEGIPIETTWDKIRQKVQDKFHRLKRIQTELTPDITEEMDTYLAQELIHGKTEAKLDAFEQELFKPLRHEIVKSGTDIVELEEYLYAKHAPERNKHIEEINPEFREAGIPGSGMSNEESKAILAKAAEEGKTEKLEKLAKMVYDINSRSRKQLLDAGLISEETKSAWEIYNNYVPLRGINEEETRPRTGRGFDVRGKESKRALGRKSQARNILAHTVLQMNEAIIRAEKNKVGQTFLRYVQANPNSDLWEVDKVEYKPVFDEKTGEVVRRPDPRMRTAENVMSVKEDGKEYHITIHDPSLARGMVNLGAEKSNIILNVLGATNRYLSIVNTSLVPEFVISNLSRDLQTAIINMGGEYDAKLAIQIVKDIPMAMKGVWQGEKGKKNEWADWYKEFKQSGGKIGFFGLEDINQIQANIAKEINLMKPGKKNQTIKMFRATKDLVMRVNEAVENSTRLATYVEMRKRGMSKAKAASVAKNVTVNFNRKGELGTFFNSLYIFSNAGIQGTTRLFQALKTKRVQKIAAGIVAGSLAIAQMNRFLAGEDDDDENFYDKIPNWIKENNIIIMRPDIKTLGKDGFLNKIHYIRIPVPYGYNVFHAFGQAIDKAAHNRNKKDILGAAAMVAGATANAFNPLGSASTLVQMITPTAGRWLTDLSLNMNFFGAPIMKKEKFGVPKAKAHSYFKSTSEQSKAVAQTINAMTGGTKYQPGMIDISPDLMDYIGEYLTGGAGRTLNQAISLVGKIGTGKEIPIRTIPMIRRFMGEIPEYQDVQTFYDHTEKLDKIRSDYKYMLQTNPRKAIKFREKNRQALRYTDRREIDGRMTTELNKFEKTLREIRIKREEAEKRGQKELVKRYNEAIQKRVKQFNKMYKQRVN